MGNNTSTDTSTDTASDKMSNADFIANTSRKLKDAGISQNVLTDITQSINAQFMCDDECKRQRELALLKSKWNADKKLYKELPKTIKNDEKTYYLESENMEFYNNKILKVRYNNEFKKFKNNKIKQLDSVKENNDLRLDDYKTKTLAKKRMHELYKKILKKNKELKRDIDNFYKKVLTEERKVYYENEIVENLDKYHKYILIIYFAILVLYLIFGPFFEKQNYKNILTWIVMIIYVIFPFLLNFIFTKI